MEFCVYTIHTERYNYEKIFCCCKHDVFICISGHRRSGCAGSANPATDFDYDLNEAGDGVIIKKYTGTATEVVIPAEIEDFPVVGVGFKAFSETNIVSAVFPDSDIWIGDSCFEKCKSLQNVVLPKNLKTISASLFYGCTSLKAIILPNSIETIYQHSFQNSGLEMIDIPDSVTVIEHTDYYIGGAFAYCKNLKTVNIGKGIKSIKEYTFYGCSSLTTVNINVEKVEYSHSVFSGCSSLSLKEKKKIRDTGYTGEF